MSAEENPEDEILPDTESGETSGRKAAQGEDGAEDQPVDGGGAAATAAEKPEEKDDFLDEPNFADSVLAALGGVDEAATGETYAADDYPEREPEPEVAAGQKAEDFAAISNPEPADELPALADDTDTDPSPAGETEPSLASLSDFTDPLSAASSDLDTPFAAQKHDALAEAVQSALLAVYGEGQNASAQGDGPSGFSLYEEHFAAQARPSSASSPDEASSYAPPQDAPRPEDIILNYFAKKAAISEPNENEAARFAAEGYGSGSIATSTHRPEPAPEVPPFAPAAPQFQRNYARQGFTSSYSAPQPPSPPEALPASFPVPAPANMDMSAAELKDSGRLLGAAGLGLIGGIAFAAVLAVFIINSYSPDEAGTASSATPSAPRASQEPVRSAAIQPQDASPAPSPTAPPVLAAAPGAPASESPAPSRIVVADVSAPAGATIPLDIGIEPAPPNQQTLISISGLPAGARLNSGVDAGGGNWLLPPRRLRGLTLTLPGDVSGPVPIEVQLLDSNVRTPLSDRVKKAVAEAAAREAPVTPAVPAAPAAPAPVEPPPSTAAAVAPPTPAAPAPEAPVAAMPSPAPAAPEVAKAPEPARPQPKKVAAESPKAPPTPVRKPVEKQDTFNYFGR